MNCHINLNSITITEDKSIINDQLVYGNGDPLFSHKLENALSIKPWPQVAIVSFSSRLSNETDTICDILAEKARNISTLRFTFFAKDDTLPHMLRRLANKVSCHTLIISMCGGFNWQDAAAGFIRQTESLQTVKFTHMQITPESLRNGIIGSSLVNLEFILDKCDRKSLSALAILISHGQLHTLKVRGNRIGLSAIRIIASSLKKNTSLHSFIFEELEFGSKLSIKVQLPVYLDIFGYKANPQEIVSSNHTLKNITPSLINHLGAPFAALRKCLDVNNDNIPISVKIKKKILLNTDALQQFVTSISIISKKDSEATRVRRMHTGCSFVYWLGQNNIDEEMKILSLGWLYEYFSICDTIRS